MGHTAATRETAYRVIVQRRAAWLAEHGPCRQCGAMDNLHVHHRDPADKIDHNVWSWSEDRRRAELAKCDVLCARCHIRLHKPVLHGIKQYQRGCRCTKCRLGKSLQMARWRARHPYVQKPRQSEYQWADQYVAYDEVAEVTSELQATREQAVNCAQTLPPKAGVGRSNRPGRTSLLPDENE